MKRTLAALGLVLVLTLSLGGTASAFINEVTVAPKASLTLLDVVVTGTIDCTAGQTAEIVVRVVQASKRSSAAAVGLTHVVCSGSSQDWTVEAFIYWGQFKRGPATATYSAAIENVHTYASERPVAIKIS